MKSWYRLIPHSKAWGPNNTSRGAYLVRCASEPQLPRAFAILWALRGRRAADGHKSTLTTALWRQNTIEYLSSFPADANLPFPVGIKDRATDIWLLQELYQRKQTMWKSCRDFLIFYQRHLLFSAWRGTAGGPLLYRSTLFSSRPRQSKCHKFIYFTADGDNSSSMWPQCG